MVLTHQTHSSGDVSPTYANMDEIQDLLKAYSSDEYLVVSEADQGLMMQTQYRDPPPYPGHSKQMAQPSLRQSFSGSETSTDVSVSSMENLSSSQRQEPQGEETATPAYHHHTECSEEYSIMARLAHDSKTQQSSVPYYGQVPHPTDNRGYLNSGPFYPWAQTPHLLPQKGGDSSMGGKDFGESHLCSNTDWAFVGSNQQPTTNSGLQAAYFTTLTPPPQYPGANGLYENMDRTKMKRSYETVESVEMKSCHSQPDLHRYWETHNTEALAGQPNLQYSPLPRPSQPVAHELNPLRTTDMVEILTEENKRLREDINIYCKKVSKLQKFEMEIQKVHEAYESLVQSSQKREKLEKMMKKRLEEQIRKLVCQNKTFKDKLDKSSQGSDSEPSLGAHRDEGTSALLAKNKELQNQRDRFELEVATLRTTVQGQTDQLDILDGALTNAQSNVVRLEKECCVKQVQMERLDQLQRAFSLLQSTCEKREQMETKLRTNLEKKLNKTQEQNGALPKTEPGKETASELNNIYSLQRLLNEKEAKILQLETEVVKWEQKYLEENMRQLTLQNPELRDQWSFDLERLQVPPKVGPVEEVFRSQITELESKVKSLQTQLAEKDAMIRVFQRAPMTRSSSVHTLNYCTPLHSPRPSLIATGTLTRQGSQSDTNSYRDFPMIRHFKTGSTSALETGRKFSLDCETLMDSLVLPDNKSEDKEDSSDDEGDKVWQV
ncbi:angiomotin-like isoform X2 [Mizuhopecten yessoensis]|uniref:Angiomotin n=1 Tax=Mizuhopecten yessoensis TaxID=6573 RepID=A0A210R2K8_MIZYE|nr:angiomotin-like isoform X2 [Mizuhopecten yessoensis]OWF55182.1 Angiomotin [Mizuhopecten yessoensis]